MWYVRAVSRTSSEITVGDRGRIILPASLRKELGIRPGTRLLLNSEDDGSISLRPYRAVVQAGLGLLAAGDEALVDELLSERRVAAASED